MDQWKKRLQVLIESARKLLRICGKKAVGLSKEAGSKWIPAAMRGLASGFSRASKALTSLANKLRKNVKKFSLAPFGLTGRTMAAVPVGRRRPDGFPTS